jgi:hypothetical protein
MNTKYTIEVINSDNTVTVSSFIVLNDDIKIIDYYLELLEWQGYCFIVYKNGVPLIWDLEGGAQ